MLQTCPNQLSKSPCELRFSRLLLPESHAQCVLIHTGTPDSQVRFGQHLYTIVSIGIPMEVAARFKRATFKLSCKTQAKHKKYRLTPIAFPHGNEPFNCKQNRFPHPPVTNHLQLYHQVVVFTTWSLVPAILIHFCFNPNLSQSLDIGCHRLPQNPTVENIISPLFDSNFAHPPFLGPKKTWVC